MRLFIGIPVPERLAIKLAQHARGALPSSTLRGASVRWTEPSDMHITLSFLGKVDRAMLPAIEEKLASVDAEPFLIDLDAFGVFPRARILFAGVKACRQLSDLAESVQMSMEQVGFRREERPYTPHITMARIGRRSQEELHLPMSEIPQRFRVDNFHLYRSEAQPGGVRYQILATYALPG